ncbi:transposable element Tcb2 transposase [Trichonephila clavipes]|nr:transposable element Tcb2 transposase [Trichonephila clavipes]
MALMDRAATHEPRVRNRGRLQDNRCLDEQFDDVCSSMYSQLGDHGCGSLNVASQTEASSIVRSATNLGGRRTLPWPTRSPDLPPVEHVWDQPKRQMPSCHSVHDLELAVQDLSSHLPQDNIRCLINSMLDRVAACIAAGGGPTLY